MRAIVAYGFLSGCHGGGAGPLSGMSAPGQFDHVEHRGESAVLVPGADEFGDPGVGGQRVLVPSGVHEPVPYGQGRDDDAPHLREEGVAGGGEERRVEGGVGAHGENGVAFGHDGVGHDGRLLGGGHRAQCCVEGGEIRVRAVQRGERGRGGLDGAAELKEVGEEAAGRAGVDGPAQYVAVEEVPVVARA